MADDAIRYMKELNTSAPDKPFLVYYVPGATHSPSPPDQGVDRQDQRDAPVRPGLGKAARADLRQPEAPRCHPAEYAADAVARGAAEVGFIVRGAEEDRHPPGRRLRRLHRVQRPRDRPRDPGRRGHGQAWQHAGDLHQRRQRHEFRRLDDGHAEHDDCLQRRARVAGSGVPALLRVLGIGCDLPAHGGALGMGLRHAVQVGQAGGIPLRRHAPGHGDLVARPHRRCRRHPSAIPSRDRHRADDPRGCRDPRTRHCRRYQAEPDRRREHGLHLQEGQCGCAVEADDPVFRDLRQPRHLQGRLVRGDDAARAALDRGLQAAAAP